VKSKVKQKTLGDGTLPQRKKAGYLSIVQGKRRGTLGDIAWQRCATNEQFIVCALLVAPTVQSVGLRFLNTDIRHCIEKS